MDRLNIRLVVVSFEKNGGDPLTLCNTGGEGGGYYLDEDRALYSYFGMHQARFWDLWGLRTLWTYFRLIGKGRTMQKSTGDIYQRGGDVLLSPDSTVRFHGIADGPADRPDPETLFRIVEVQS